ncbi:MULTISPECIES: hypothetical protein [Streptomycetaceae]|uniref:WXG100 family type VII secretion target n=1 Tax=Streptantibioticus cattleyicolor (strain ATCC 35852 / DSM 46488 / JCM 4925 / NBRC 14057 / NRRL 8057) TaxID=1003195 RepID=G8WNP1_STREN|nr:MULTISPECIES: hypothetical protein [Streptomycetaceae]AEW92803.1 hypothetical protein SCATT_04320 [Streptantibioticus cattleyicolor NRRL 8057 = DSM 46488]MYS57562.1 hypothetical protein [Streptomyces sp. SID5468]
MADDQQQSSDTTVHVDTVRLKSAAEKLKALGERLQAAGQKLDLDSSRLGHPWGDDKTGGKFYDKYKDPHSQLIDAGLYGGSGLMDSADQITEMIKAYEDTEEQNTATGRRLSGTLDSTSGGQ